MAATARKRNVSISDADLRWFVEVAGSTRPIQAFTDNEEAIKNRFLTTAAKILRHIGQQLGLEEIKKGEVSTTTFKISTNPAGPAVSGDVSFETSALYIHLSQTTLGFMWRWGKPAANQWLQWDRLLNIPALLERWKPNVKNAK